MECARCAEEAECPYSTLLHTGVRARAPCPKCRAVTCYYGDSELVRESIMASVRSRPSPRRRQSHVKATLAARARACQAAAARGQAATEGDTGHSRPVDSCGGAASDPSLPPHANGAADPIRVPGGCCSRTSRALSAALAPRAHVHLAHALLPRGSGPPTRETAMGRRRHG